MQTAAESTEDRFTCVSDTRSRSDSRVRVAQQRFGIAKVSRLCLFGITCISPSRYFETRDALNVRLRKRDIFQAESIITITVLR